MKKKNILRAILLISMALSACAKKAAPTAQVVSPAITSTPDLCSKENLPAEVVKINKLTREFDDYSALASHTAQTQLVQVIPELQRVLREAEDQSVPACLTDLKKLQLVQMNTVVQTLLAFMNTSPKDTAGVANINAGIAQSRKLHGQYDVEMARLLGITLAVPPTFAVVPTLTASPATTTPVANVPPPAQTATSGFIVTNPGPLRVNLRNAPDLNAITTGGIEVQASVVATGRTADNLWIQVQLTDQPVRAAWVYATLVKLSVPIEQLPVVTP